LDYKQHMCVLFLSNEVRVYARATYKEQSFFLGVRPAYLWFVFKKKVFPSGYCCAKLSRKMAGSAPRQLPV